MYVLRKYPWPNSFGIAAYYSQSLDQSECVKTAYGILRWLRLRVVIPNQRQEHNPENSSVSLMFILGT